MVHAVLLQGVHGQFILVNKGDVFMLMTGDLIEGEIPIDDAFWSRRAAGAPMEMSAQNLYQLRALISEILARHEGGGLPTSG